MIMIIFKNRLLMKEEIYEKIHSSNKKKNMMLKQL